jgi:adenosylcobinamide-GDP ribazoletransferase
MKRRLQGYTGDCCGALFVVSELMFYIGIAALTL